MIPPPHRHVAVLVIPPLPHVKAPPISLPTLATTTTDVRPALSRGFSDCKLCEGLSISRVDANHIIKIFLGSTELQSQSEALGHLTGIRPHVMEAYHLIALSLIQSEMQPPK